MPVQATVEKNFFNSLKRGTGEAYLLAIKYPHIDFSNYITKGALKNYAYDGQCEQSRAEYIFDLICTSPKKDRIRKAVLKALANEQNDTWSLTQLFDLAKLFAKQGDDEARREIYDRFLNHPIDNCDWAGYTAILELDGLNGLFYIAEKFGKVLEQNPDDWEDASIIYHFQEDNPEIKVWDELKKKGKTNKYIRVYLENVRETEGDRENYRPAPLKYADIVYEVVNSKPYLSRKRTKELTDNDVKIIADSLVCETDIGKKEKLLHIFRTHKFPLEYDHILRLAKQNTNTNKRLKEFAIEALSLLKSKNIRDFALSKISTSRQPQLFARILVSNFKKGDSKLLAEIVGKVSDEHKIEQLAYALIDIFKANRTKNCKKPLEILYSKTNCGICRKSIVEVLIENGVLSKKLREEIKYDCNPDTRELAK